MIIFVEDTKEFRQNKTFVNFFGRQFARLSFLTTPLPRAWIRKLVSQTKRPFDSCQKLAKESLSKR